MVGKKPTLATEWKNKKEVKWLWALRPSEDSGGISTQN